MRTGQIRRSTHQLAIGMLVFMHILKLILTRGSLPPGVLFQMGFPLEWFWLYRPGSGRFLVDLLPLAIDVLVCYVAAFAIEWVAHYCKKRFGGLFGS